MVQLLTHCADNEFQLSTTLLLKTNFLVSKRNLLLNSFGTGCFRGVALLHASRYPSIDSQRQRRLGSTRLSAAYECRRRRKNAGHHNEEHEFEGQFFLTQPNPTQPNPTHQRIDPTQPNPSYHHTDPRNQPT